MSASQIPPELLPYLMGEKEDYSSLQGSILKINITFVTLILITTALRFWVRFRMLRAVGLDDGKMGLSYTPTQQLIVNCSLNNIRSLIRNPPDDILSNSNALWIRKASLEPHPRHIRSTPSHSSSNQVTIWVLPILRSLNRLCKILHHSNILPNLRRRYSTPNHRDCWLYRLRLTHL